MMKKNKLPLLLFCFFTVLFSSCNEKPVKSFLGDFTYKTSGSITVEGDTCDVALKIANKLGQMDIIDIGEENRVMVIKTEITGNITKTYATISSDDENKIIFDTIPISEILISGLDTVSSETNIFSAPVGKRYEDRIVIEDFYFGYVDTYKVKGPIKQSDVITISEKNK
ncbi:MAG TPA: hypothetical protein PLG05_03485 [Bacteroidales bacterium]|nr:hypothetical protein [Bacteroidales bacterium]HOR59989.1 hypothetical protein [Bacteroidales bacterium]HPL04216.1 hypothetical protein [Bacteroidales bacterium]